MKRVVPFAVLAFVVIHSGQTAIGGDIKGKVFDLKSRPEAQTGRTINISVTGITKQGNDEVLTDLPDAVVNPADGTFRVAVDPKFLAVTLVFTGDGLKRTEVNRLVNKDQAVEIAMPEEPPAVCPPPVYVRYCPAPAPKARCRLFRR